MATNFGPEATQISDVQNFVSPKEGVAKDNTLLEGAASLFEGVVEKVKQSRGNDALSNFSRQQLNIIDGLEQGKIKSSRHAGTLLRQNLINALDAAGGNSDLAKEILNAHAKIRGFSKSLDDGTLEERRIQKETDDLFEKGLIDENTSEAELQQVRADERARKSALRKIEDETKAIQLQLKRTDLSKAERAEAESQLKDKWRTFTREQAPRELRIMRHNLNQILSDPELSASDKQLAIEEIFTTFEAQNVELKQVLGSEAEDYMIIFNNLKETYIKGATGELSLADLERQNKKAVEMEKAMILSDPTVRFSAGVRAVFGEGFIPQFFGANPEVNIALTNMLKKNSSGSTTYNPYSTDPDERRAQKTYTKAMIAGMNSSDPEVVAESVNQFRNFVTSLQAHQGTLSVDPRTGINTIETLASDSFLKAVQADPSILDSADKARQALDVHFYDEVFKMVEDEFNTSNVVQIEQEEGKVGLPRRSLQATPDAITYEINDNIIEFVPVDEGSRTSRAKAEELNKTLAPIIRNLVKADAHLKGTNNYKAIMEKIAPMFVASSSGEPAGGDEGDDLQLDDFKFPTVSTGGLPAEVAADEEFLDAVDAVAEKHEITPQALLAVIDFETGGTFDPSITNAAGSGATGLIQFIRKTAKSLGTSIKELKKMSRAEQMVWVDRYLDQFDLAGKDTSDVYMAVLFPKAIGKSDDFVLFREGTKAYSQNAGLDRDNSGKITKAEAARKVVSLVGKHE